ncbi:MAG: CRTAC1 family protein, partial [Desulfobacterales bacterium]|nr:CRTAC1 family protein [Desulfobacterales bacterium]
MGVAAVDLLQRGWLDLYVTHLVGEGHGLFLNHDGQFSDAISPDGPMAGTTPFTGFGLAFADFDNDGELDLYVAQGRVRLGAGGGPTSDPYAEPNLLRRGRGQGRFEEVTPAGGVLPAAVGTSRGLAAGDLDNDGSIDLVVIERDAPLTVLRNRAGQGRHWVQFELQDREGRDVRNAILQLESGGRIQWRQHQPNEGYCSSQDPRSHFGLGEQAGPVRLRVRWPGGTAEEFGALSVDRLHRIQAGRGTAGSGWFTW